jgi:hypothetical protein
MKDENENGVGQEPIEILVFNVVFLPGVVRKQGAD